MEMIARLNGFDSGAGDYLATQRGVFSALLPEDELESFENEITGFAFTEARSRLERAAGSLEKLEKPGSL
jgi:hypothetical protein